MRTVIIILVALLLVACQPATPTVQPTATVLCTLTPTVEPTVTPVTILWDPRLTDLGLTVERVPDAKFRLVAAWVTINGSWDNVPGWARAWQRDTLGGDHHAFGRAETLIGEAVMNKTFMLSWPGGADGRTPETDGWANIPLFGQNWQPADGSGPYNWESLKGDRLRGLGLPYNWHYSFFVVWREITP